MKTGTSSIARYIDHTLLKPEATDAELRALCSEAAKHSFYSVCVNGANVKLCKDWLYDTPVKVCAVVGFPLGAMTGTTKAFETTQAVNDGADEIDMVINVGALKSGRKDAVLAEIRAVVEAARGRPVKVILETSKLTNDEKVLACTCTEQAGAQFVKTSTGFGGGGATIEDIALMHATVPRLGVKASGGVRDFETAMAMIKAGATRIGTSSGITIVTGEGATPGAY